jgi:hypothetical protein
LNTFKEKISVMRSRVQDIFEQVQELFLNALGLSGVSKAIHREERTAGAAGLLCNL